MKQATFANVLPYILCYIAQVSENKNDSPNKTKDRLYNYVPDKSKTWKENNKWIMLAIPLIVLLFKSQTHVPVEHAFVLVSYVIGIKSLMNFLTPNDNAEYINASIMCILLTLIYHDIIPKDKKNFAYIYITLTSTFLLALRNTTSSNVILDLTLTHFVFFFSK